MEDEKDRFWISQVKIQNFKSINDATVDLHPNLNIIIGKNGVGKSNLLDFINSNLKLNSILGIRRNRNTKGSFSFDYSSGKGINIEKYRIAVNRNIQRVSDTESEVFSSISIERSNGGQINFFEEKSYSEKSEKLKDRRQTIDWLRQSFPSLSKVHKCYIPFSIPSNDELSWLGNPSKLTYDTEVGGNFEEYSYFYFFNNLEFEIENKLLNEVEDGPKDLDSIKQFIIDEFYRYSHKLRIINPIRNYSPIQDIRLNQNINIYEKETKIFIENLVIDFLVNNSWIPWSFLSDGTKRMFALIIETVKIDNGIIIIEEPELGIHPSQLYQIMDYLKSKSYYNQIILSTHSPLVLDILQQTELDYIIIAKMSEKGTKFFNLTDLKKRKAIKYMNDVGDLSSFWLHSDLEDD